MIRIDNLTVYNISRAIYSARNAMNSWDKSDSDLENDVVGSADLELAKRLYRAGPEHSKYLRQIFVSLDIVAPLYWWKEMDTYKVGTTANSCSTMHKLAARDLTIDDFSHEHLNTNSLQMLRQLISLINEARALYVKTDDKREWWQMIQLLPSSYNQLRTLTLSYANIVNMINQREHHKLDEWRNFCESMLKRCPYLEDFVAIKKEMVI